MKKCPKCGKVYDESWSVCLDCRDKLVPDGIISSEQSQVVKQKSRKSSVFLTIIISILLLSGLFVVFFIARDEINYAKPQNYTKEDCLYPHITISSDDQHIAFAYRKSGVTSIYTAKIDGTDVKQLTHPQSEDHIKPEFSPDGSQILFLSFPLNSNKPQGKINLMNVNGTDTEELPSADGSVSEAVFSPNGKKIYFLNSGTFERYSPLVQRASHGFDIYSIALDSKEIERLTNKAEYSMSNLSAFSNGKQLLYCEDIDEIAKKERRPVYAFHFLSLEKPSEISYLKSAEKFIGTDFGGGVFDYAISPDDKLIAFTADDKSQPGHRFELYLMNLETDQMKQVTQIGLAIEKPRFFHNQDKLLFMQDIAYAPGSGRQAKYQLMQINADGSDLKKIDLIIPKTEE
jgi:TolB protein